jgi:hypothetical protein
VYTLYRLQDLKFSQRRVFRLCAVFWFVTPCTTVDECQRFEKNVWPLSSGLKTEATDASETLFKSTLQTIRYQKTPRTTKWKCSYLLNGILSLWRVQYFIGFYNRYLLRKFRIALIEEHKIHIYIYIPPSGNRHPAFIDGVSTSCNF